MVTLYGAAMLIAPRLLAGSGRLGEAAGVFPWGVLADGWAAAFVALLGVISTSVYVWSYYYMDRDPAYRRFMGLLTAFVASMLLLILFSTLFASLVG